MNSSIPCVSFIGIVDFSEDARWLYLSESVSDLLGFETNELMNTSSLKLVHPDEFPQIKQMHYDTIRQDKAAVLAYLRLKHKDPYKGYVLCAVSRTVVHNVLVGSVSFAAPGAKAMHNASTAQEVEVITPSAKDFELRRWGDPSPMPPSPVPLIVIPDTFPGTSPIMSANTKKKEEVITFAPLPTQSIRTALILDRFTVNCTIQYCSNDELLETTRVMGRPIFDFVVPKDEDVVRSWIDVIKAWGVNERGQPSDGGFGFGKFKLCPQGRDSSLRNTDAAPSGHRHGRNTGPSRSRSIRSAGASSASSVRSKLYNPPPSPIVEGQKSVDAIFSAHSDGILVILRSTCL